METLDSGTVPAVHISETLRKQILKLRWIGQNDDADRLIEELVRLEMDAILIGGFETD